RGQRSPITARPGTRPRPRRLGGAVVAAGLGGVIEAPGGPAGDPADPFDVGRLWLAAARDPRAGRPVILLTHSMSGAYGWRLRETHGRAIEAVVGVAPAPPGNIQAVPPMTRETEDHVELAGQAVFPQLDKRAPA